MVFLFEKWRSLTIRVKLILIFTLTLMTLAIVNVVIFSNINDVVTKTNQVYRSNMKFNQLAEGLEATQKYMTEYLNTKSSDALQGYYTASQTYSQLLEELNVEVRDNGLLLLEKNIYHMSQNYLKLTDQTMQAKRGRNIQKYKQHYEKATELFDAIKEYVSKLNNEQFKINAKDYKVFLNYMAMSNKMNSILFVVLGVFDILLIYLLTYTIISPLSQLAKSANEIAKGNFEVPLIQVKSLDEIGIVARAFNHMTVSIKACISQIRDSLTIENEMKERELIMATHLKDAQLKYLQAQINPHFLFNTLNAGAQLAMLEDAEKTCIFIENMADFFRYNIKNSEEDTTLEEEIKLVDNYIHILNVRFADAIHFEKEVEESLLNLRMPRMILQPLIENAVQYGIREIEWEGKIKLTIYRDQDQVWIDIQDNGIGIEEVALQKIRRQEVLTQENKGKSNGIGLSNVIKRLKLYYNKEDVFEITSEGTNQGTLIRLSVPYVL